MRIAVLAHGLRRGGGASVGKNFISAFGRIGPQHDYLITVPGGLGYEEHCARIPLGRVITFDHSGSVIRRVGFEKFTLPGILSKFEPDVILGLGNVAAQTRDIPQVLLLHNPYYVYPKEHFGRTITFGTSLQVTLQRRQFARDLSKISVLMCQTRAMAQRVKQVYGYGAKIHIIPNAVSRTTTANEGFSSKLPAKLNRVSGKRRLFCLTAYYSHKNLEVLIDLARHRKEQLKDYAFLTTVAPGHGAAAKRFLQSIEQYDLQDTIVNAGPLEQSELSDYYNNCEALFLPTLLESFSGAYLEAMHFGLPILTSDYDFAREVCGDAAIYFDPADLDEICNAIMSLDKKREGLTSLGTGRLEDMYVSWDVVAKNVLNIVEGTREKSEREYEPAE